MIELSQSVAIIVGELLFGLILLISFLLGRGLIKRSRIRNSSRHLVARIEADKPARTNRLRSRLEEYYGYSGEALEQAVHDLTQAELHLYQNIINSYLKQDVIAFQQTDVDVENLVISYQQLQLPEKAVQTEQADETGDEIKHLEDENQRLSEELRLTMDTMGHMLNEYSSMFEMNSQAQEGGQQPDSIQAEGVQQPAPASAQASADSADSELRDDGLEGIQVMNEGFLEDADELVVESLPMSVDEPAKGEESLMDELEPVDIDLPDAEVQAVEPESPDGESLEEEWARLLEEDADSAEAPEDEAMPQGNRAPEAP